MQKFGARVKAHYDSERGGDDEQARKEVADALKKAAEAMEDAFEALGKAAKDPAVKDEARDVGASFVRALGATFEQVSAEVRSALDRARASRATPTTTPTEAPRDAPTDKPQDARPDPSAQI
jgi:hypothetical protein